MLDVTYQLPLMLCFVNFCSKIVVSLIYSIDKLLLG